MHCQTLPRWANTLLLPHSDLTCKVGLPHRRPLRKVAVYGRAATSDSYRARQRPDASRQAKQLSQLAKEVFEMALQSGPKGFTRSMQAANAFASIGRYTILYILSSSTVMLTTAVFSGLIRLPVNLLIVLSVLQ